MGNSNGKALVIEKNSKVNPEETREMKETRRVRPKARLTRNVPKAIEGEQVAAGWPAWLSAVAGEAINGWVPRSGDSFDKLAKIGQGSYSNVYMARDRMDSRIVALKKVRVDTSEPNSVRFMAKEILILRRLDHPNVIKLEGLAISRMQYSLYLVLEYMEHDLTGLTSIPGIKFTEPQIKCYMHQLLCGLEHCHDRGVLHRDIKNSNLLVNNDGVLKIADFGLSSFFDLHRSFTLTSEVVTLWYRPPELLLGATNYGVEVDLWSTGCVLGELYAGKPIMPGKSDAEQLHRIFKLCGSPSEDYWRKHKLPHENIFKPKQPYRRCLGETYEDFPVVTVRLLETLLSLDPESRGTASLALNSEFFTKTPFACHPSDLPKYSPDRATARQAIRPLAPIHFRRSDASVELSGSKKHGHHKRDKSRLPSPVPSNTISQMFKELGQQIQGATRQTKLEEIGVDKVQFPQMQTTANPVYSNPLLAPSNDVDMLIEEHDRHIQESVLKMRLEKRKAGKVQAQEDQLTVNKAGPGPSLVPSSNLDQILEEQST